VPFDPGRRLVVSAAVATALVVLVPSAATASGGHGPDSVTSTTAGVPVTLTVTIVGKGSVVSYPAGISCGSTCSAQFSDGTEVALSPLPANGYVFGGFSVTPPFTCHSVNIHDPSQCTIYLADSVGPAASVQATFLPYSAPPLCTVPDVRGKTLAKAEALLTRTHCGVGTVKYVFSLKAQKGRVISQNPKAHWQLANGTVDLVVGKGRRKSHQGRT
jgi:hypothetical protein